MFFYKLREQIAKTKKAERDYQLPFKIDALYPEIKQWVKIVCTCSKQITDRIYIQTGDLIEAFPKEDIDTLKGCWKCLKDDRILQVDDKGYYISRFVNYDSSIDCTKYKNDTT